MSHAATGSSPVMSSLNSLQDFIAMIEKSKFPVCVASPGAWARKASLPSLQPPPNTEHTLMIPK